MLFHFVHASTTDRNICVAQSAERIGSSFPAWSEMVLPPATCWRHAALSSAVALARLGVEMMNRSTFSYTYITICHVGAQ